MNCRLQAAAVKFKFCIIDKQTNKHSCILTSWLGYILASFLISNWNLLYRDNRQRNNQTYIIE